MLSNHLNLLRTSHVRLFLLVSLLAIVVYRVAFYIPSPGR